MQSMSGGLLWQKRTRHADAFHPRDHQRLTALLSALTSVSEAEKASKERGSDKFSTNDVSLPGPRAVETSLPASGQKSEALSNITPQNLQIPLQLQLALAHLAAQQNQSTENLDLSHQLAPQSSCLAGLKADDKMESSSHYQDGLETVKECDDDDEKDTDSNSNHMTTTSNPLTLDDGQKISEEARKRRRQEINRESARRVRKRKSEAHKKLQEEVTNLKATVASVSSDQAVIVRYASELYKEREMLVRRAAELESKWVAAECQIVVLRQQISDFL